MKKLIFIVIVFFAGSNVFAQQACGFKTAGGKSRHDQYAKSSKENIEKSKKEMEEQADEFDTKKYQATVKNNKAAHERRKTALRYY